MADGLTATELKFWIVLNTRHKPRDLDSSAMLEDKLRIELKVFFRQEYSF